VKKQSKKKNTKIFSTTDIGDPLLESIYIECLDSKYIKFLEIKRGFGKLWGLFSKIFVSSLTFYLLPKPILSLS